MKTINQLGSAERDRYLWRDDELRKMRRIATALLILMAVLFVIGLQLERNVHHHWGFLVAFAEAGMVGGLADWFAVTALFRHPLGIPIPHTAIIPTNKERLGRTLASFLRSNFLRTGIVARKVRTMDVAGAMGRFLSQPSGGEGRMRMGASRLMGDIIAALDDERLGGIAKSAVRQQLEKLDVAPLLGQLLGAMIKERRHLPLMDGLINWASKTLEAGKHFREIANDTFAGKWLVRSLEMTIPLPAPRRIQPGPSPRADVLDAVVGTHDSVSAIVRQVADTDWRSVRMVSPFSALVT